MTYLVIGNNQENIKEAIHKLLSKLWEREIKENIFTSSNPDIHILKGSNLNSIGIDDVKALQKEMLFSPFNEPVQIALISNAEKLTTQAQNSFLKTLEETPDNTSYILVTNNEKHLLPTIISRAFKIYTKEEREMLTDSNNLQIIQMDMIQAFENIEKISKERKDTEEFLKQLELHFQNLLEEKFENGLDSKNICDNIVRVIQTEERVKANGNRRLLLENLFLNLNKKITP